jgi:transposase
MQEGLFTVAKLDDFVPTDHPLRSIRTLVNDALKAMNAQFNAIYASGGRDSIAPEKLIRALLLQVFYSVRSERQLCEQLRYNLLFRWFVGLALDDPIWDHSVFSKNRDRLLAHQVVEGLFAEVCAWPMPAAVVEGTLLGRRHADSGVGEPEELSAEGWQRRSATRRRRAQRASRLERPTP